MGTANFLRMRRHLAGVGALAAVVVLVGVAPAQARQSWSPVAAVAGTVDISAQFGPLTRPVSAACQDMRLDLFRSLIVVKHHYYAFAEN